MFLCLDGSDIIGGADKFLGPWLHRAKDSDFKHLPLLYDDLVLNIEFMLRKVTSLTIRVCLGGVWLGLK